MRIKKLFWNDVISDEKRKNEILISNVNELGLWYVIKSKSDIYVVTINNNVIECQSVEEAEQEAQRDFEKRIFKMFLSEE